MPLLTHLFAFALGAAAVAALWRYFLRIGRLAQEAARETDPRLFGGHPAPVGAKILEFRGARK